MDDIIYEKDYRKVEPDEHDEWYEAIFDRVINGDMLKSFSDAMDKIPKIIVPEDKKNYEYLLERCDEFVKQHHGRIEGIVDYHHWHSEINLFLPFVDRKSTRLNSSHVALSRMPCYSINKKI